MTAEIAHTTEPVADELWRWSIWLEGSDEELDAVESVLYTLESSFPDPVRSSTSRSDRFRIDGTTASSFHYYAAIASRSGAVDVLEGNVRVSRRKAKRRDASPERPATPRVSPSVDGEADGVFEALGPRVVALAGALRAAEECGIKRWVNVAGVSAGATVAALLAVGYSCGEVSEILRQAPWTRLIPKRNLLGTVRFVWQGTGLDDGKHVVGWLEELFAASPAGRADVTFGDVALTESTADPIRRHRLRIVASDLSTGKALVLPEDLGQFEDESGDPLDPARFPLARAVFMSMALPFVFQPQTLRRDGRPHLIVDGGILSSFPVWLFDGPTPRRPTWGMKVFAAPRVEAASDAELEDRLNYALLVSLVLNGVMDADVYNASPGEEVRSLRIPSTLTPPWRSPPERAELDVIESSGYEAGLEFFSTSRVYRNSFGATPRVDLVKA